MAIPFLNNINLSDNQLLNAKLQLTSTAPTAAAGQIYFDSTTNTETAKYYSDATDGWVSIIEHTYPAGVFITTTETGSGAKRTLTSDLSATGTADATTFLTGNNTWSVPVNTNDYVTGMAFDTGNGVLTLSRSGGLASLTQDLDGRYLEANQTITLSGDVTGSGATAISTTISANAITTAKIIDGAVTFPKLDPAAVVLSSEGIPNNDNDTTLPTSAAVKAYVDAQTAGGLVYQGGYNASTNVPVLDSRGTQIAVEKGWTYTATADGTFYGETIRIGDVLIAEVDLSAGTGALTDWTTVQNNIDLADASTVGIGNVNVGTGIDLAYSGGTATVSLTAVAATSATGTIAIGALSGTVSHTLGINTMVQTINSSGDTVFCDVTRTATSSTATIAATEATAITILVQKIG